MTGSEESHLRHAAKNSKIHSVGRPRKLGGGVSLHRIENILSEYVPIDELLGPDSDDEMEQPESSLQAKTPEEASEITNISRIEIIPNPTPIEPVEKELLPTPINEISSGDSDDEMSQPQSETIEVKTSSKAPSGTDCVIECINISDEEDEEESPVFIDSDISEKCNPAEFFEKNYIPVAPKLLPKNNTDSDNEDEEFTETEFEGLSDHYNDGEFFNIPKAPRVLPKYNVDSDDEDSYPCYPGEFTHMEVEWVPVEDPEQVLPMFDDMEDGEEFQENQAGTSIELPHVVKQSIEKLKLPPIKHKPVRKYNYKVACTITGKQLPKTFLALQEKSGIHPCLECGVLFEKSVSLKSHMSRLHNPKAKVECPESGCRKMLSSTTALKKHRLTHLPECEWPVRCKWCGKYFQAKGDLPKHFDTAKHKDTDMVREGIKKDNIIDHKKMMAFIDNECIMNKNTAKPLPGL